MGWRDLTSCGSEEKRGDGGNSEYRVWVFEVPAAEGVFPYSATAVLLEPRGFLVPVPLAASFSGAFFGAAFAFVAIFLVAIFRCYFSQ